MTEENQLGSLQSKILYFLAENPKNHKQAIQKGIRHPPEQYGSVLKAVNSLEKGGYIKSRKGLSKKNRKIKFYGCTEKGVSYTLVNNTYADIIKILDNYKEDYPVFKHFRNQYDVWGHNLFVRFYSYLSQFRAMQDKYGLEATIPHMYMMICTSLKDFTPQEKEKILKVIKLNPAYKKYAKQVKGIINEIL